MKTPLLLVIVEDSAVDAEIIARHLGKTGLDVIVHRVETEEELVLALREKQPDLILSDFSLPRFSGLQALEAAVVHAPDTPFIYVSGTIGEERAIDALQRGATDYVLKSNLSRLSSAVERALREASLKVEQRKSELQRQDQERRLKRLTRSYRMLSSTSSAILRLRDRSELLDEVCRIAVQQGGYDRVSISLIESDVKALRPRSRAGRDFEASGTAELGIAESAMKTKVPATYNDLTGEQSLRERCSALIDQGCRAVAALPLLVNGTPVGAITLFSGQSHIFDEAELNVLMELTANLSFALQYLEKDEALHFLSYFDSLTGLAKRPLFCQRLSQFMLSDPTVGTPRTVVVFDLQQLGAINDSFGRYMGDLLIEQIAMRLKQTFADPDALAYFGGGTFAVTLVATQDPGDAGRLAQTAATRIFTEPFQLQGEELRPTIRSGIAFHPNDGDTAEKLVQNAEAALKMAREDNEKYQIYSLVTKHPTSRSMALEGRLACALDRGELLLHYQPKVRVADGSLEGFEALLRWQDTQDGLVSPAVFVPLLERSGAIVEVGEWILLQAVRDMRSWFASGLTPVRVAINVSPLQLRRRDFVDHLLRNVEPAHEFGAGSIDIEITESMLLQDLELSIRKLAELREAGVGIAIDDFGTGYSSLSLLARLPIDTLKIDRSFVQSIADSPKGMTLVSTIVSLARSFDLLTVAEGVETFMQLQMLQLIKCDQAQGFLFQRPIAASEVPAVIARLSADERGRGRQSLEDSNTLRFMAPGIARLGD